MLATNKRTDHKEVKNILIGMGIKSKKDRAAYHALIVARHYGHGCGAYYLQDQKLLNNGFDSWRVTPVEIRRNWQDQPD